MFSQKNRVKMYTILTELNVFYGNEKYAAIFLCFRWDLHRSLRSDNEASFCYLLEHSAVL